ncbi:IS3 family transposase [Nonomuraea angiospora]|uniref:IS3 family transposase n=1 Tax=Nonomuraea angiospora TaxID=46172 RepID=UPI003F55FC50
MRFRLIHAEKDHHEVSLLARVLGVSRQGCYAWAARLRRGLSARARRDAELAQKIQRHHQASDEIYGAPRIHADLREMDGERVGRKRVARLMRAAGLAGVSRRKGCRTTITDHRAVSASDLVKRRFTADEPNQVRTAGITYVPTWQGFVDLAVVLDVFSRRIVGWAMAEHMCIELVTDALAMALHQRRPPARGDSPQRQGQYTSIAFDRRRAGPGHAPTMRSPEASSPRWSANSSTGAHSTPGQKPNEPSSVTSKGSTIHDAATPQTATSAPPNTNADTRSRTPKISTMLPRSLKP